MKQLLNHRVIIFQEGNYKFEGKIIAEDELFLEIFDEKDQQYIRVVTASELQNEWYLQAGKQLLKHGFESLNKKSF